MLYKLTLKNCEKTVVVDDRTYEYIQNNAYLQQIEFLKHLRIHSNGYAFFQKNWPLKSGKYKNETIYLHKMIGEQLLEKPESNNKLYVHFKNGNKLDCRIENLEWAPLCKIVRNTTKTENKLGVRGVHKEAQKYRAIIHFNKQRINLGTFETLQEAAQAYSKKSEELFGKTKSLKTLSKAMQEKYVEELS
ncbi:HNH endonuclease [Pontibacter silvestris]|uniref:HNH endonuclease n=1 Tax=Pontibacter silvestris TaxID=2305183 RepID=A0ABW4WS15_9BACT|nr:HNH endonuclease [Pontibacter silvestris]MCC9136292.1 HNH endonuclease [Pontibacter silvestris]